MQLGWTLVVLLATLLAGSPVRAGESALDRDPQVVRAAAAMQVEPHQLAGAHGRYLEDRAEQPDLTFARYLLDRYEMRRDAGAGLTISGILLGVGSLIALGAIGARNECPTGDDEAGDGGGWCALESGYEMGIVFIGPGLLALVSVVTGIALWTTGSNDMERIYPVVISPGEPADDLEDSASSSRGTADAAPFDLLGVGAFLGRDGSSGGLGLTFRF